MRYFLLFNFLFFSIFSFSQTRQELEQRKQKTEEEIKLANEILEQTQKSKSAGINKLLIIKKRINLREQLIRDITNEINYIDKTIEDKNKRINQLESDLNKLKKEYEKMIYFAYKNRNNYDRLMFILASEDFNQAYRRIKYFEQYTKYRRKQASLIFATQKTLEYEIASLKGQKNEKLDLLAKKEQEKNHLSNERIRENREIAQLKTKENQLRKELKTKEKIKADLQKKIEEIIAREAARRKLTALSASEEAISEGFRKSMGNLTWPIENGIIIRTFGEIEHPILKGIKINNEGIDISTRKDSKVRSIFEGEVTQVFAVPGNNMAIIIRHGHFLTLYSNLVNVRVRKGDIIPEGFHIGDVYYNPDDEESSILHLRVYEETKVLNPEKWLSKH
ncbi:MAG: peptidoglycan DD-metalloendopeptidase family protein [Bacteroidota bacterium]|nr:peptidoglycan DD-metalloendopeptidase family protein [Bacteroidota bacterium]